MSELFETARGTVHAWQCNHMGHANLRAYGEFFEQSLWQIFHRMGITPSLLRGNAVHMAGVRQDIRYRKELLPGDVIFVRSGLVELKERALRMVHEMIHIESGEVCAVCELTAVCPDARARKSRSLPKEIASHSKDMLVKYPFQ